MTITNISPQTSYTGNGSTVNFPSLFKFFGAGSASEITVIERVIATGVESTLVYTTDYTVTGGSGETGTVVAATAPASTVQWHIRRNTTRSQQTDYVENDEFPANAHESALDRLTAIVQELEVNADNFFRFPVSYTPGIPQEIPVPTVGDTILAVNTALTALEWQTGLAASVAATAADVVSTSADVVLTNADVVSTAADVVTTNADAVLTAADAAASAVSAAAAAASAAGFRWKDRVLNATTANITLSGEQTIDGVLTSGSRILVKDQSAPAENGIYVTAAGAWSRAPDMDTWLEVPSVTINVEQGTALADTTWIVTSDSGGTLDTTAIDWAQIGAPASSATTAAEGLVELATNAEVNTGTDTGRVVTPVSLAQLVTGATTAVITASDEIIFADVGSSNAKKKDTVQGILDLVPAGALEFVSKAAITAATTLVVTGFAAGYDYIVELQDFAPTSDGQGMWCRVSDDNGANYRSTAGDYGWSMLTVATNEKNLSDTKIQVLSASSGGGIGNDAGNTNSLKMELFGPNTAGDTTNIQWWGSGQDAQAAPEHSTVQGGGFFISGTTAHNAVQFLWSGGSTFKPQGNITVWRRKRS